jgi:uncharacterized protein involved in exopolysaccharide biosynthesis
MDNTIDNEKKDTVYFEFSIIDIVNILLKYKRKILIITLSVGLLAGLYIFLIAKPIFLSTGTVKTTSKSSGLAGMVTQGLPDIGDLGDLTGSSAAGKELALYENILTSRRCLEEAIIKFNLNEDWDFKYMQDGVKNFRDNILDIKKDKLAGTMDIGIYDDNQTRAKDIAEFMISQLNKINIELNVQNAKANREFIEQRYYLVRQDLRAYEDSLKTYQDSYGIAPDLKAKAVAQAEIQMETEVKSEEIKLEMLRKILSPEASEIKLQENKIADLKNQLYDILNSKDSTASLNLKGAPKIILNYLRLVREVEIQNKMLAFILPLYEQAKIEEKKETPSVIILDQPNFPEKKTKPRRLIFILISLVLSFTISSTWFIIYSKWKIFKAQFLRK